MKSWVVYGTCGKYSDFKMWLVAVSRSETSANKLAEVCREWVSSARTILADEDRRRRAELMFFCPPSGRQDPWYSIRHTSPDKWWNWGSECELGDVEYHVEAVEDADVMLILQGLRNRG